MIDAQSAIISIATIGEFDGGVETHNHNVRMRYNYNK